MQKYIKEVQYLQKTGKKYTINGLSGKLIRESITLKETLQVLDILGYHLEIKKNSSYDKVVSNIRDLLNGNNKIKLIAYNNSVSLAFTAVEALIKKKEIAYDEELYVKHEIQKGKGRAKIFIAIKKKI